MDWAGSVTGIVGLVLINVAWNYAPLYGYGTAHVYFILIIDAVALAAYPWLLRPNSRMLLHVV